MAKKMRCRLMILTALIFILSIPACGGNVSSTLEEQTTQTVAADPPRISIPPAPTATTNPDVAQDPSSDPPEAPPEWGDVLIWVASGAYVENGIQLGSGGDVDTEAVLAGDPQEQAQRFGSGEALPSDDGNSIEDYFMRFNIDDAFLYRGSPTSRVLIEVEYLDEGTDSFFVEYDAESGGPNGDGRFKPTDYVIKSDSGDFMTAVFWLNDAYFGNRIQDADFRIDGAADGAETIRRVTVTRIMPGSDLASSIFMNFYHDGNQLTLGQCTTLHWEVQNASRVTLNGSQVDPQTLDYECPQSTTTYVLQAQSANEQVQEEITIEVSLIQPPAAPATYNLRTSCDRGDVETTFEFYVWVELDHNGQTSEPVTFDAYTGSVGNFLRVASVVVPSLGQLAGMDFLREFDSLDPCCQIILRGNNDMWPGDDAEMTCP